MKPTLALALILAAPSAQAVAADDTLWVSLVQEAARAAIQGDFQTAEPLAQQAVEEARRRFGPGDSRVAISLCDLGDTHFRLGRFQAAEQELRQAAANAEDNEDRSTLAKSIATLAAVYSELGGRTAEVEALRTRAVDLARIAFGREHHQVGIYLSQLSISLIDRRRYRDAEAILQQALQLVDERTLPAYAAEIWVSRGAVAYHMGHYPEALERVYRALGLYEKSLGTRHPTLIPPLISIAHLQLKLEILPAAGETIERARQITVSAFGDTHPLLADVLALRAQVLRRSGRKREAKESERQAKAIAALHMPDRRVMNSRIHVSDLVERR